MDTVLEIIESLKEEISEAKGAVVAEIILIISWITYLIRLDKLNEILKTYYSVSDGIFVKSFKIVFSDKYASIMLYLLLGFLFLFFLIGITFYLFKQGNNMLSLITGIINFILIVFILNSLLAPILISIAIVFCIVGVVVWSIANN
ncbi:hypothetical protein LMG8520_2190 [Lactococcus lactis subsp. lactis]|uniref:Uncharacterized protein n=2 Tax=Lactococcus lactis TaxID=1358 RepID=A0A2A5S6J0_LACLH|nr:hypothetical protein [Lactococcus lactis]KAA8699942.1 hypothetical protein F4V48_11005 [Lactococcus lactis subsp. hordniae]KSU06051.1 hypothetical protein LMG8520_2190 [Lactococcus lactis subsp. lactis]MCT3135898.1 hypothetical protein [Lactococcus lactis]PCS09137.1 hypothetical protein RU90_GL002404 [Lactococcus lactis subsp. hordniae]